MTGVQPCALPISFMRDTTSRPRSLRLQLCHCSGAWTTNAPTFSLRSMTTMTDRKTVAHDWSSAVCSSDLIYAGHNFTPAQPEASALSLQRGMDNECADFFAKVNDDHDYKPYVDAVKQGLLKESEIDTAVTRLFTARMKLGMFDPPEMVPYSKIDEKELDSAEHRALARKLAN